MDVFEIDDAVEDGGDNEDAVRIQGKQWQWQW